MKARRYQNSVIREVLNNYRNGIRTQMVFAATGSGKTFIASKLIKRLTGIDIKSVFIVPKIELVDQAVRHLESFGLSVGVMQAENTLWHPGNHVVVASIQTIRSRGMRFDARVIFIDEAHRLHQQHIDLMNELSKLPVIGLSATPLRDGLGKYFQTLVKAPSINELTNAGHLVPVKAFARTDAKIHEILQQVKVKQGDFANQDLSKTMNSKTLVGDIVSTWQKQAEGRPTLCFACDIAHSKQIVDDFRHEGIHAMHLDAYTPPDKRYQIVQQFREGFIDMLSSVNVLAEGFDAPLASCGILARPTLSRSLYIQQVGRLLRPAEGKTEALILDHAGNIARFGMPDQFDVHSLDDAEMQKRKVTKKDREMAACNDCGYINEPGYHVCPNCGFERIPKRAVVDFLDGELVEVGDTNQPVESWNADQRQAFYRELMFIQHERGYSPKHPAATFKSRFNRWPPWSWSNLTPVPPTEATLRYDTSQRIRWSKRRKTATT